MEHAPLIRPTDRVQPSFRAQFRAVFLKNMTLQARQRVSLAFQLIPLISLLVAAATLSVLYQPAVDPDTMPSCQARNWDPSRPKPICWDESSYSGFRRNFFDQQDWYSFWSHDGTPQKIAGNLTRYGPLGPSYNGVLGYQGQRAFLFGDQWNETANVPFFDEKSSWETILDEYQYLRSNYSQAVKNSKENHYCFVTTPRPNDPICRFEFKLPQAAISFDSYNNHSGGIDIGYRVAKFPRSMGFYNDELHSYFVLFDDMINRWLLHDQAGSNTVRVISTWSIVFIRVQDFNFLISPGAQIGLWCLGFGLLIPFFMTKMVIERGSGLTEVSKMAGLSTAAYWGSMIVSDILQLLVAILICVIIGLSCGFVSLLEGGIFMYLGIFAYGISVMSFGYLFSIVFTSLNWAYFFGYIMGLVNAAISVPLNFMYFSSGVLPEPYFLWYPPLSASRALFVLVHATAEPWAVDINVARTTAGWCVLWSLGMSIIFILIPILPDLYKEIKQRSTKAKGNITYDVHHQLKPDGYGNIDENPVELEEAEGGTYRAPLKCQGLSKTFVNDNGDTITAVSNVTFQIQTGDCFGLLGPNGAGKTTLINMLVGYLDVSGGNAFIDGHSISTDLAGVQESIGLCPQFDVHYGDLTVREHLLYYSRLWGFTAANEKAHVKQLIQQIGLHDEKHRKAESLSGGQKRRLSIGIALSGNPSLILLDEPSSGLDVGSQRAVWDIICEARKQQRSFLLTTHSMTEAEVLCNRIGIMSQGQLVVTGTPQQLKRKYGSGFKIDMLVDVSLEEDMRVHPAYKFISSIISAAELVSATNGYITFQIPKSTKLSKILTQIEMGKKANGIINWGLSQSNLQEVFLALTRGDTGDGDNVM